MRILSLKRQHASIDHINLLLVCSTGVLEKISTSFRHHRMDTGSMEHLDDLLEEEGAVMVNESTDVDLSKDKSKEEDRNGAIPPRIPVKQTDSLRVGVLEGTTFLNDYIVVSTLGRGAFGKVKLCLNVQDNALYAVKVVEASTLKNHKKSKQLSKSTDKSVNSKWSDFDDSEIQREAEVMKALNHPNLVQLYEVIRSSSGKTLMVMEYCEAGPLVETEKFSISDGTMPEIMVQHIFRQIVLGLNYLHSSGIVHGDIKPENMLLSGDGTVKISDFGQSQILDRDSKLTKTLGTPAYLSPEICAGEDYDGFAADIWALGVSLYYFVFGKLPFESESVADLYDMISDDQIIYPEDVALPINLQDLFIRLLNKNPKYRIKCHELLDHPWLSEEHELIEDMSPVAEEAETSTFMSNAIAKFETDRRTSSNKSADDDHAGLISRSDSSKFAAQLLRSLSQHQSTKFRNGSENLLFHSLHRDSGVFGEMSGLDGGQSKDHKNRDNSEKELETFKSVADQLLETQREILEERDSMKSRSQNASDRVGTVGSGNVPKKKSLVESIAGQAEEGGAFSEEHASAVLSSALSVISQDIASGMENIVIAEEQDNSFKSPFEDGNDHLADVVNDAALMHFKAGEEIDQFGTGGSPFSYFIDQGSVELRYRAELPVPLDEVVRNCVYNVLRSQATADLSNADSLCFAENASSITLSHKKSGVWDSVEKSASSLFSSSSPFFGLLKSRTVESIDYGVETSVTQVMDTAERMLRGCQDGTLGNLLTAKRGKSQFLGILSITEPEYFGDKWFTSAVALEDVVVIRMTREGLERFLVANPLSQIHLRASMATSVSEILKLEALEKIALARRKMLSSYSHTSQGSFTTLGAGLEEVAKHITDTAVAGAEILAKLDIFALASKLRDHSLEGISSRKGKRHPKNDT